MMPTCCCGPWCCLGSKRSQNTPWMQHKGGIGRVTQQCMTLLPAISASRSGIHRFLPYPLLRNWCVNMLKCWLLCWTGTHLHAADSSHIECNADRSDRIPLLLPHMNHEARSLLGQRDTSTCRIFRRMDLGAWHVAVTCCHDLTVRH